LIGVFVYDFADNYSVSSVLEP